MKALSLRQPWVFAILHFAKDVENRNWAFNNPAMHTARTLLRTREPFLLHASKSHHMDDLTDWVGFVLDFNLRQGQWPGWDNLPRGGIVGVATLVDVVTQSPSRWFAGPRGLVLADVRPIPFVPFKGALGFFDVPDSLVRKALAA